MLFEREQGFRRDPKDTGPPASERVAELRAQEPALTQAQVAAMLELGERTVRKYWHVDNEAQGSLLGDG